MIDHVTGMGVSIDFTNTLKFGHSKYIIILTSLSCSHSNNMTIIYQFVTSDVQMGIAIKYWLIGLIFEALVLALLQQILQKNYAHLHKTRCYYHFKGALNTNYKC